MKEKDNNPGEQQINPKKVTTATRVTDLEEVRRLIKRPEGSKWVHPIDEASFEKFLKMVARTGAILKGHFLIEDEDDY